MAQAIVFIESALRKIQIKSGETPLAQSEIDDALETLNDMGAELEANGYELGFTQLASETDEVTIPQYANNFYKTQLAGRLATEYLGGEIPTYLTELIVGARKLVVRELNRKSVGTTGTIQNLIFAAIEMLNVKGTDEPLTTGELENGLPKYNDLVNELIGQGFETGATIGATLADNHGIDDYAIAWYKAQLALRLGPGYGAPVNETIVAQINEGRATAVREQNRKSVGVEGTYRNIIYGAIEIGGFKGAQAPVNQTEIVNGLPRLDDLMAELNSRGFHIPYNHSDGSTIDAEHNIQFWAWAWIKAELAVRLSSSYSAPPSNVALKMAQEGMDAAYNRFGLSPTVDFPDTMPLGTSRWYGRWNEFARNTARDDILTDTGESF